jgi:hypothetical protein
MYTKTAVAASNGRRLPRVLDHVRVHPLRDGGHTIEHHFTHTAHKPESYKFKKEEGQRAVAHLLHHTGLPRPEVEEQGGSEPESWMSRGTSRASQIEAK